LNKKTRKTKGGGEKEETAPANRNTQGKESPAKKKRKAGDGPGGEKAQEEGAGNSPTISQRKERRIARFSG